MKKAEIVFNLFSIPIDAAAVFASAIFAYFLRIQMADQWPILFQINLSDYLKTIVWILPFLLLLFAFYGLYNLRSTDRLAGELLKISAAVTTALMLVVFIFFFDRDVFPSRLIVLLSWAITIVFVSAGRIILRFIRDGQLRRGRGLHKLAVIKGNKTQPRLIEAIRENPELGYEVIGVISSGESDLKQKIDNLRESEGVDEILQADPEFSSDLGAGLVHFCHDRGIKFNFVPDIFGVSSTRMEVEMMAEMPVIKLKGTPLDGWGKVVKRILDICLSLLALIILSPVILLIYLAIKLDSRGPAFYIAARTGSKGDFKFYKFRTMYTHLSTGEQYGGQEAAAKLAELTAQNMREGPVWKIKDDPRVTKVGRFLRKTKLDEIPQFINVLKGDMSLVGPRAHITEQVQVYSSDHRRLFTIKPGIFGLTQISQLNHPDLPFEEETRLDVYYIENWSAWLDLKIILQSIWMLLTGKYTPSDN